MDSKDEIYHLRCLQLAENGLGRVAPNPLVGAVIVANDKVIGEGFHSFYGGPHAEVNAINSVEDKSLLIQSTLYVNLEPCAHHGKTPPCADLIIEKKIKRVVISHPDPFEQVSGKGIEKLKNAGIEVKVGILEKESRFLNRRFLTFYENKRPYVILKWAETADGFIDIIRSSGSLSKPTWITDEYARTFVHKWRSEEQSILVGTNTAMLDNPKLNVRDWKGKNPIRMVIDNNLRLPGNLSLFDKSLPTIVFNTKVNEDKTNLQYVKIDFENLVPEILAYCYSNKIQSVIVEGGTRLLETFILSRLWDEARVFKANVNFGEGIKAPKIEKTPRLQVEVSNSILNTYFN